MCVGSLQHWPVASNCPTHLHVACCYQAGGIGRYNRALIEHSFMTADAGELFTRRNIVGKRPEGDVDRDRYRLTSEQDLDAWSAVTPPKDMER